MAGLFRTVRLSRQVPLFHGPTTPHGQAARFGLFPVRSPLLRESLLISFPAGTEMFQFPAFALLTLCIQVKSTCFILRMNSFLSAFTRVNAPDLPPTRAGTTRVPGCSRCSTGAQKTQQPKNVRWVSPFGNPRIKGCSPLPTAYRRVPRPSSPLIAKASTKRPSCA